MRFPSTHWAVVLGGSSGFGLATAQKLAEHGMHCFLVHRDRRGAMARIEPEFERIRRTGVTLVTMNTDALDPTAREECLEGVARGQSNKEIAAALAITDNTVKNHLKNILEKLHLENRVQAATYALRSGLVRPQ